MQQRLSPAMVVVAVIVVLAIVGLVYWKTMGTGSVSKEAAKWSKPAVMTGPLQMPNIPPPPPRGSIR